MERFIYLITLSVVKYFGIKYLEIEMGSFKVKAGEPDCRVTEVRTDDAVIKLCGDEDEKRLVPVLNNTICWTLLFQEFSTFLDRTPDIILVLNEDEVIVY